MRFFPSVLVSTVWFLFIGPALAQTVTENIFFIKPDGVSYISYNTTRSSHDSYRLFLNKDEKLDKFLYINPNNYEFDRESDPQKNILIFPQGSYATMRPGDFSSRVTIDENGVYHYVSWDEEIDQVRPDGHYGLWNSPDNYAQFVYAWVLPDNFEVVDRESNREGDWVLRKNTLAWYGSNVNDLIFTIRYRPLTSNTLAAIRVSLEETEDVAVAVDKNGVKVSLASSLLFESGSTELSEAGKATLERLAESLHAENGQRIIVEGHTDNAPLTEELRERFDSNWELSAARSLSVVRFLQQQGISGDQLESRAMGEFRPLATNETEEGRAQNRRIEILVLQNKALNGGDQ